MFAKPSSPYNSPSSSTGLYGNYFGPHPQVTSPLSSTNYGGGMSTSFGGGQGSYMVSPTAPSFSAFGSNLSSLGGGASAPFLVHGQHGGSQGGGGPGGFGSQFSPPQTQIIGGLQKSPPVAMANAAAPRQQTTSPRFYSTYSQNSASTSPIRNDGSEPMHYSPIHPSGSSPGFGSPSSSSFVYGMHNTSPGNSSFMPSFLLGFDQHHHSFQGGSGYLPVSPLGGTPHKSSLRGEQSSFLGSTSAHPNKKSVMFDASTNFGADDGSNLDKGENGEGTESTEPAVRVKGPPKHGFGHSSGSSAKEFLNSPVMQESYCPRYTEEDMSSPIPNQRSSTSQDSPSSNWVTVFGFPSGASSFILTQFSTCGKILEVKSTPGSNWLHLRFSNKIESRRALTKNGKVVGGSIMVGVMNSDPKVVQEAEETPSIELPSRISQPGPSSSILKERNTLDSSTDSFKSRLRPLATGSMSNPAFSTPVSIKSYSPFPVIARESIEVDRNADGNQSLPSASNGIFTKAMEFMFGW